MMWGKTAIRLGASAAMVAVTLVGRGARADEPTIAIGNVSVRRYADPPYAPPPPPPNDTYLVVHDPPDPLEQPARELYRAPFRLHLATLGVTTGRGLGLGLGVAADFGRGSVGFRVAASWLRGESDNAASRSVLTDGLGQYTGELTLDFNKRGPVHPVLGLGFGLAHVNRGDGAGNIGIGVGRVGIEYAVPFDDADVRLALGITGVLPGPADREVQDVRGYALFGAGIGIGF